MKKEIKTYSVSLIVIVLLVMLGYVVYAEDNISATASVKPVACTMDAKLCPDGVTYVGRIGPNCEFAKCPGVVNVNTSANVNVNTGATTGKGEVKVKIQDIKNNIKENRVEKKTELKTIIQSVKDKRETFKTEMEVKKEGVKVKMVEVKANFKESLTKIKDEKKKISAEKIVDIIASLNTKLTVQFSAKIDQIENVLVSIESRISKAEERGLDVSSVKIEAEKAKIAIDTARIAISLQSSKVYEVNVTSEATLRVEMKKLRDTFSEDIKVVREKVKQAHVAVRNTATTLAKIPKIDEEVKVNTEVEVNSTANNN